MSRIQIKRDMSNNCLNLKRIREINADGVKLFFFADRIVPCS